MKQTIQIAAAAFLITAAVIKAAPALAEPVSTPEVNVALVRTADLDLSSEAGQRQLDSRLVQAAREVCGAASDVDLAGKNQVRHCRTEVLARANAQRDQLLASNRGEIIAVTASR
jgi:UrcA family protein